MVGQGLDTLIFIVVAYVGTPDYASIMILNHWLAKIAIETAATPLTYTAVNYLKKREAADTYDHDTNFNPFLLRDRKGKASGQ